MEKHRIVIIPCFGSPELPPPHGLCNSTIAIALGMGPTAFRCPACNVIYVVDPLRRSTLEIPSIGFSAFEIDGHWIETFSGERAEAIRSNMHEATKFYTAKVGGLENVYVATLVS